VVERLSFEVPAGALCALLGPNGAGKTTTVRMLLGLVRPTAGTATVAGVSLPGDPAAESRLRARVGLLTETPGFYDRVSAWDNLFLFGRFYGLPEARLRATIERHLRFMELWERRAEPVAAYSKGMKQRLAIIRAIFHDPEVIFLDEPTGGLDPQAAREVRSLVGSLKREGRTIILCTHNLHEAEELADLIAVMRGSLLAFGRPGDLTAAAGEVLVDVVVAGDAAAAASALAGKPYLRGIMADGSGLRVELGDWADTPRLVADLVAGGARVQEVRPRRRSLEQVYLEAVGGDGR
jgi:ABC-2 type transport system ATP-binding protein